jgi:hypothetical protein
LSAQLVPPQLRDALGQRFTSVTGALQQQVQGHLDGLDPSAIADVRDPFAWVLAELAPLVSQGLESARDAFADLPVGDYKIFPYMMQLGMATARQPRLPSIRRALLITAVASAESTFRGVLHRLVFDRDGGSWDLPAHDLAASKLMEGGIERWERNLREALIFGERNLRLVLAEYEAHYNGRRPHRSRQLHPPQPDHPVADLSRKRIQRWPVLGGLINEYERAA